MGMRARLLLAALVVTWTAAPVRAQWMATPYLGANVAGDLEFRRGGPGVSVAYLGHRLGFELDVERYHHFFKDSHVANPDPGGRPNCAPGTIGPCTDINTDAIGVMGNLVAPFRIGDATKWLSYAAAGLGVMHAWFEHPDDRYDVSQNDLVFDVGAGVVRSFSDHVGLRGDLRYLRAPVDETARRGRYFEDYGFWRVTVGITFGLLR